MLTTPSGRWSNSGPEHQRGERRQLRGLADDRVAGRQGRRQLPAEQQQRVVPGDDAADHPQRLLQNQGELGRLDRGDHPPGGIPPDLGVVVERGDRPADLIGVLHPGLAALERHGLCQLVRSSPHPGCEGVQHLAALHRRRAAPVRSRVAGGGDRRVELLGARRPHLRHRLLGEGVLDLDRVTLTLHLLAVDQEPCLELRHGRDRIRRTALPSGRATAGGRPGGEGIRPPVRPPAANPSGKQTETALDGRAPEKESRAPARCLDSIFEYPSSMRAKRRVPTRPARFRTSPGDSPTLRRLPGRDARRRASRRAAAAAL